MIFKGKRSGIIQYFTMDVNPGFKYIENFQCGVVYYRMESKNIFSSICFYLKNVSNQIVSLNCQNITFRLPIKET